MILNLLSVAIVAAVADLWAPPVHVTEGKVSGPRGLTCELMTEKGGLCCFSCVALFLSRLAGLGQCDLVSWLKKKI